MNGDPRFEKGKPEEVIHEKISVKTNAQERLATSDLALQFPELSHLTLLDKDKIDKEHTSLSEIAVAGLESTPWTLSHRQEAFTDIFVTLNQLYLSKLAYENYPGGRA